MNKGLRKHASTPKYISPKRLTLEGFESPFERTLNPRNRWVVLAHMIPWDEISSLYLKNVGVGRTGRPPLSPRVIIGSLIIKHLCNLDDRETVDQITENMYMQYFLGYTSFTDEAPFDASLFVDFRKRLGMENVNAISERIVALKTRFETKKAGVDKPIPTVSKDDPLDDEPKEENKGRVILDATHARRALLIPLTWICCLKQGKYPNK